MNVTKIHSPLHMKIMEKRLPNDKASSNDYLENLKDFSELLELYEKFENSQPQRNGFQDSKELANLTDNYTVEFYSISRQFEKWAVERRKMIKTISDLQDSFRYVKSLSAFVRLILSTTEVVETLVYFVLNNLEVSWSSPIFYAAAGCGCLSVLCSIVEESKTNSVVEKITESLKEDERGLRQLGRLLARRGRFEAELLKFFPHSVDRKIVQTVQNVDSSILGDLMCLKQGASRDYMTSNHFKIWLAVYLSNIRKDPSLSKDEKFLARASIFSKKPVAERWWNKLKYKDLPISDRSIHFGLFKSRLISVKSLIFLPKPLVYSESLAVLTQLFLGGLRVLDAYSDLNSIRDTSLVTSNFEHLTHQLYLEYMLVMNIYEEINPYE